MARASALLWMRCATWWRPVRFPRPSGQHPSRGPPRAWVRPLTATACRSGGRRLVKVRRLAPAAMLGAGAMVLRKSGCPPPTKEAFSCVGPRNICAWRCGASCHCHTVPIGSVQRTGRTFDRPFRALCCFPWVSAETFPPAWTGGSIARRQCTASAAVRRKTRGIGTERRGFAASSPTSGEH